MTEITSILSLFLYVLSITLLCRRSWKWIGLFLSGNAILFIIVPVLFFLPEYFFDPDLRVWNEGIYILLTLILTLPHLKELGQIAQEGYNPWGQFGIILDTLLIPFILIPQIARQPLELMINSLSPYTTAFAVFCLAIILDNAIIYIFFEEREKVKQIIIYNNFINLFGASISILIFKNLEVWAFCLGIFLFSSNQIELMETDEPITSFTLISISTIASLIILSLTVPFFF